jgi:hypothetical protein
MNRALQLDGDDGDSEAFARLAELSFRYGDSKMLESAAQKALDLAEDPAKVSAEAIYLSGQADKYKGVRPNLRYSNDNENRCR